MLSNIVVRGVLRNGYTTTSITLGLSTKHGKCIQMYPKGKSRSVARLTLKCILFIYLFYLYPAYLVGFIPFSVKLDTVTGTSSCH